MVDFPRKRLQVFVSSTYSDLILERQAAVEAILSAGHIPAGMELFTAGDESQMDVIKQWIEESDVYMLILGGRYGSIEPKSDKSYTQLEYEYAISLNKPFFACVIKENAIDSRVKLHGACVIETERSKQLRDFRQNVLNKMVKFWEDTKDIKIATIEALSQFARKENLIGWVRPNQIANLPAITDEFTRLSKENAELRVQISKVNTNIVVAGIPFQDMLNTLEEKGLLHFIIENKYRLINGVHWMLISTEDNKYLQELLVNGIIELTSKDGQEVYVFTQDGKMFLNNYEVYLRNQYTMNLPT